MSKTYSMHPLFAFNMTFSEFYVPWEALESQVSESQFKALLQDATKLNASRRNAGEYGTCSMFYNTIWF